jgi:fatty acid desaturase
MFDFVLQYMIESEPEQDGVMVVMEIAPEKAQVISWYRSPLLSREFKALHERSDLKGFAQSLGHLGLLCLTGGTIVLGFGHISWLVLVPLIFLHGMIFAFMINAVHELGHGTVFKTKFWNEFFVRIYAFFGWINFEHFSLSHARHHRYTLHQPDDLEVVLPIKVIMIDILKQGIVNYKGPYYTIKETIRVARGKFSDCGWEKTILPESNAEGRCTVINWSRTVLIGHGLLLAIAIYFHLWMLPVVTTLAPFYGQWLFMLCNNTQHVGLQDDVPDFRLCCRTFTLNPVVQFFYWHMNYHIEHHMYAAVPCYNLGRLHRAIKSDLPACPHGIVATWKEICAIQAIQDKNPEYQHVAQVSNPCGVKQTGAVASIA